MAIFFGQMWKTDPRLVGTTSFITRSLRRERRFVERDKSKVSRAFDYRKHLGLSPLSSSDDIPE
jgi:hypothetical protein